MARSRQVLFRERPSSADVRYIPEPFTKTLNFLRPQEQQVEKTELDGDGSLIMQPNSQPEATTCYRSRSLLFFVTGEFEPKLGVKWRRLEQKSPKYEQTS